MMVSTEVLYKHTNKANKYVPDAQQTLGLTTKCQYLRIAYGTALTLMPQGNYTWKTCCDKAIKELADLVLAKKVINSRAISRWNTYFRQNENLPHPNAWIESGHDGMHPLLFELFPYARQKVEWYAMKNLDKMSGEYMAAYLKEDLIPYLFEELRSECEKNNWTQYCNTLEEFYTYLGLRTVCTQTAINWLVNVFKFQYKPLKRCYYNDKHEDPKNKIDRYKKIETYLQLELRAYRWIQLPLIDAQNLEDYDENPLRKEIGCHYTDETGREMREYHVDSHPDLIEHIQDEYVPYGGCLSVRKPPGRPVIFVGQDESTFSQYSLCNMCWTASNGERKLLPKGKGEGWMVSAFQGREIGFGRKLTELEMAAINRSRSTEENKQYKSTESAIELYGTDIKQQITCNSPFITFFELGDGKEGYWNSNHIALQTEDVVDCLQALYPDHDLLMLFDHSSGHAKNRKNGLRVQDMNMKHGGKATKTMRESKITINCLGPYAKTVLPEEQQQFVFQLNDDGPFYLSDEEKAATKDNKNTGKIIKRAMKHSELMMMLKTAINLQPKKRLTVAQLCARAIEQNLPTDVDEEVVEHGWCGAPKGMLQILWERGWINEEKIEEYTMTGKKHHFEVSENGKQQIKDEYKKYQLPDLLSNCEDFENELTELEHLAECLSTQQSMVQVLMTTKYHCEIAGEGIEMAWGYAKRCFKSLPLKDRRTKALFHRSVKESLDKITIDLARRWSGRCRRYMIAYKHMAEDEAAGQTKTYSEIERFVKEFKTHRNANDYDKQYISRLWQEAQGIVNNTDEH
jgi:hypothetical protein